VLLVRLLSSETLEMPSGSWVHWTQEQSDHRCISCFTTAKGVSCMCCFTGTVVKILPANIAFSCALVKSDILLLKGRSAIRVRHFVDAWAGAFSGIGIKENWCSHLCEEAEQAYYADIHRITLTASYSESMARGVPWRPSEGGHDLVWTILMIFTCTALYQRGIIKHSFEAWL
jgi:hypothetical protein